MVYANMVLARGVAEFAEPRGGDRGGGRDRP